MNRRRFLAAGGGLVVALAVPGAFVLGGRGDGERAAAAAEDGATARATAKVARRDLVETKNVAGTLGYGATHEVGGARQGTVTALPAVGTVVDRGGQLAEVDGLPVVLFLGDRPMWRPLAEGAADGADIAQIEANLIELGYGTAGSLGPNEVWSQATTAAVKRWQKAIGVEETGTLAVGDVVFEPAPVRLAEQIAKVGSPAAGPLFKATATTKVVAVNLEANLQSIVGAGQAVGITLPDGTNTTATITSVGTVATAGQQGGSATVPLLASLDDQTVGGTLDQAPVTVRLTASKAEGVLAVPVSALLALAEGGYAVERVNADGTTSLVAVKAGAFAAGVVEVTGSLAEGDDVVVPR